MLAVAEPPGEIAYLVRPRAVAARIVPSLRW